ncbi:MAG: OPT family oligopeptide transporter [Planctomycetota bacterium]|jgi:hypothetical protein
MGYQSDKELTTYRNLIEQPDEYVDGFDIKTIIGAIFLGLLITPGAIYMRLVAGENVGPAARWVTIFLFAEVAKRSLKDLKQQEVFVLYYMTGVVMMKQFGILWNIYMVRSDAFKAMGLSQMIPSWVVPTEVVNSTGAGNLFAVEWIVPIALFFFTMLITRLDHFGLGYLLYRITSDVEKLPFPMAPIGAAGILAMAETKDKSLQWRPACFSIGGIMGIIFGAVYIGIPTITGLIFREPVQILPLPWIELTPAFKDSLPATAINIVPNLALFMMGMTLPFWAIVGGFLGLVFQWILNPILYNGGMLRYGSWFHEITGQYYKGGVLHSWKPGMQTVDTLFRNSIDFYLSFSLGIAGFIAVLGIVQAVIPVVKMCLNKKKVVEEAAASSEEDDRSGWDILMQGKPIRGDMNIWVSIAIYLGATASYIGLSCYLIDGFPWPIFLIYGFIYTPLVGYSAAKIEGMAGQALAIPMVKEAAFILSGYKGIAIWYAPIPIINYGRQVKDLRIVELTGTRIGSIIKTELVTIPILIISIVFFSGIIWSQADLNSDAYPYVQKVWDLQARNQALMFSSTLEGKRSLFFEALKGKYILTGLVGAGVLYGILSIFGLPVLLVFGIVRGLGQTNPAGLIPEFFGAIVGRFYFKKKFGDMWTKYTPAMYAGFTCGMGLTAMICVAIRLIALSIAPLDY